jgi:hypothetical protein
MIAGDAWYKNNNLMQLKIGKFERTVFKLEELKWQKKKKSTCALS